MAARSLCPVTALPKTGPSAGTKLTRPSGKPVGAEVDFMKSFGRKFRPKISAGIFGRKFHKIKRLIFGKMFTLKIVPFYNDILYEYFLSFQSNGKIKLNRIIPWKELATNCTG
jgi:hypothetical protein